MSNGLLDGKIAVVTGVSNGMGRAIAIAFAREGASAVVLADLDPAPRDGGPVTSEIVTAETRTSPVVVTCDVSKAGDIDNAVAVAEYLGGLDVMVYNAGIAPRVRFLIDRTYERNADMPTMVAIADLTGEPGSGPTLLEAVRNLRRVSIAEPGTREFSVVSVDTEPPRLIIVEKLDVP